MRKFLIPLSLSTFAFMSSAAAIHAVEPAVSPPTSWQAFTINYRFTGSAVKKDMRGVFMPAESIYSGNGTTPGNVAFTCYAGNFTVNVALEPMDMKELMRRPDKSNRRKAKRPDIKINGTAIKNADWIYMPALKVYQARRKSTAAKIYNSVVRQDTVSMRGRGKDFVPLNLPKVDAKFKEFGSECGLGTASKKAEMEPQESPEVRAFELRDHLR
jgi:hypothetical protein